MKATEVEQLLDYFGTDIFRFCMKLCCNRAEAEDLYQQTFLKVLELKTDVEWDNNPKALLFSITSGIWKNKMRKLSRHHLIAPSVVISEENENQLEAKENVEQSILDDVRNKVLNEIVDQLPDKFRMSVILFYTFEYSISQISEILDIPSGTVKSRLNKGRIIIKKRLEEYGYDRYEV